MIVLGINGVDGIFHDASATLVHDGRIVASVEEERFNRRKHSNGIPFHAIEYCLSKARVRIGDIDHIGYYLQPDVLRKTFLTDIVETYECDEKQLVYIDRAAANIRNVESDLRRRFDFGANLQFHFLNHHVAHAASAFYISGFDEAAVLTIDGSGDRESCVLFRGHNGRLEKVHELLVYPKSLGFIYTVFAAHLGLNWISGPGKLMGLAGYGTPDPEFFSQVLELSEDRFQPIKIDLSFFEYHLGGSGLSAKGIARFGAPLPEGAPLSPVHWDMAASVQAALERAVIHIVRQVPRLLPEEKNLCLSGGIALNVSTNRRIKDCGLFRRFFVSPPAYDGGTSLGCALYLDAKFSGRQRYDFDVYTGPDIELDYDIETSCQSFGELIQFERLQEPELICRAARALADCKIIGWVQGRMECGPRALGNRSILANPADPQTKSRLDEGIKKREKFRPYAPSVCQEASNEWFDLDDSPYMLLEAIVHPDKRASIPAVVHVDGTSRPQTVTECDNSRFYRLIKRFSEFTGLPLVLNTSFNQHGEPLVNRPEEAIAALLATRLDDLFIGDYHVRRNPGSRQRLEWILVPGGGIWKTGKLPTLIDIHRPISHNGAKMELGQTLRIVTPRQQWAYGAAFRFDGSSLRGLAAPKALLVQVEISVEQGQVGMLFVEDNFETVIGTPVSRDSRDNRTTLELIIEDVPPTGWLILRNDAPENNQSICTIHDIGVYRASRRVPDLNS